MPETCKTVLIESEVGPIAINESDYDKEKHKLVKPKKETKKQTKKEEKPEVKSDFVLIPDADGKIIIAGADGQPLVEEKFDTIEDAEKFLNEQESK